MEDNELIAYKIVTESQKKTSKNLIKRDIKLLQGVYFEGSPEHILEKNRKKKAKKKK